MGISHADYLAMLTRTTKRDDKPALGPSPDRESELHDQILDYCKGKGWLCIHSRMDRKSTQQKGVSDFIVVTPISPYFVEAKRRNQKLRPEQAAFRAQILKLGWPHAVVYCLQDFIEAVK